jgi:TolB-like protein
MSGDPEQEYLADGMVEEITTAVSRLPWLFVMARNSSFTYKGQAVDVKQVARDLAVQYVLEGSVRKAGNRVRITGQLIDTITGAHIWADRFDGAPDDIFDLQDEIASNVVGAIEPKLRLSEIGRATRKPTESLDAYDLYLRALGQFQKYTEEGIRSAIVLLKRALVINPSYAPTAAMIGWCRLLQRRQGWGPVSDAQVAEGLSLARQAIEAAKDDPGLVDGRIRDRSFRWRKRRGRVNTREGGLPCRDCIPGHAGSSNGRTTETILADAVVLSRASSRSLACAKTLPNFAHKLCCPALRHAL